MPISKSQYAKLGDRLKGRDAPSDDDLSLLADVLIEYNAALETVAADLRSLDLETTCRLKTSGTIIEKLRRPPRLRLDQIRDLAGARIVRPMTLDEQDELAGRIRRLARHPGDRSASDSVPRLQGGALSADNRTVPGRIQLRTMFQDLWAQLMETYGDMWGRQSATAASPTIQIRSSPRRSRGPGQAAAMESLAGRRSRTGKGWPTRSIRWPPWKTKWQS